MRDLTFPHSMDQGSINPFSDDLFVDHPDNLPGVSCIHAQTFNRIVDAVENLVIRPEGQTPGDKIGRTILVTAPEAGYGKSHLAARLRDHLNAAATAVSLPLDPSRPVAWPVVLGAIIRQFSHLPSARFEGNSLFAETGRYLLAQLVIHHIKAGNAPDCPETEENLKQEFANLFRSDSPSSILGWTDSRSRDLSRDASPDFLNALGLSPNELGFWTRLIIDFNWRGDSALEPLRGLTNGEARERLLQWLRLASFNRPVLIVADGLDGFFQSESAGMEIAGIITGIRETVPRSVTLVCLNQDIWESVFKDCLPSAWIDRLTGEPQKLRPITPEAASDLVLSRLKRTPVVDSAAADFVEKLKNDHLWIDAETKLSPRNVLRQASLLWESDAESYLSKKEGDDEESYLGEEEPLSVLTDKVDFFKALQEDRPASPPPALKREEPAEEAPVKEPSFTPLPALNAPPVPEPRSMTPPPAGPETETAEEQPENPFFAPPAPKESDDQLAGIDSIINDIRDSGKTVVSETAERPEITFPDREELPEPSTSFQAGDLNITPTSNGTPLPPLGKEDAPNVLNFPSPLKTDTEARPQGETPPETAANAPVSRTSVEARLKEKEREILSSKPLHLDLEKVEAFVQKMGAAHLGLSQTEERYPSSRTTCLRWTVRGQSVLIGFESPRNVYFWNNLLQQSLSSNRNEKITAFSHTSESFDPGLFSSFGFSPSVIRGRIDAIEMSDQELAMLYAADSVLKDYEAAPKGELAAQYIALSLDPLWRRISKPL